MSVEEVPSDFIADGRAAPVRATDAQWREQIASGLIRHEFVLHYQPQIDMHSGTVRGLEALVRWRHPSHGLLQPSTFLPLIENHKLIEALGDWAVGQAARQAGEWRGQGLITCIAVNVRPRHMMRADFMERLAQHLDAVPNLHASALELELTPTTPIGDLDRVARVVRTCRQFGIGVTLDDFGTGVACLSALSQLPVIALKLDRSFVQGVLESKARQAIIEGIVVMARNLGVAVIANGVATPAHGVALMAMGCTLAQGDAFASPMPPVDVPDWVARFERERSVGPSPYR